VSVVGAVPCPRPEAATSGPPPLELSGVGLVVKGRRLLADVDVTVPAGAVVALLGRNGAGKSTLLHVVARLRHHDAGRIAVDGAPPGSARARRALALVLQDVDFPVTVRVGELVAHVARHYPHPRDLRQVAGLLGLEDVWSRQAGGLSGGERRKVALACALVGRPRVVLLDEPTAGLDAATCVQLWQALREFAADGGAVLLSTHLVREVEQHADRAVLLDAGRVVADDRPGVLLDALGVTRVRFTAPDVRAGELATAPGCVRVAWDGARCELLTRDPDAAVRWLVRRDVAFTRLVIEPLGLGPAVDELLREVGR
jgi:ABC-2 type transport system ATP-binding protein